MNTHKAVRTLFIFMLLASNIGCDQLSKHVARNNIEYGERISVIDGYFTLTKVENSGAFLSLGNDFPETIKLILLTILPIVVLFGLTYFLLKKSDLDNYQVIGLSFIIGGGIGNLFDRVLHGSVTDFLYMDFKLFHTGIFNMADVSISTGAILIFLTTYLGKSKKEVNV